LHGELFYLCIRRWVYDMPVSDNLDAVIEGAITRFLRGAPAAMRDVAKQRSRKKPSRARGQ
jgi:hypothetical protein